MMKNKGITLIALVITIIVMLILTVVTVTMALGENGLINKAKENAKAYEKEKLKEELVLALTNIKMYSTQDTVYEPMFYYETLGKFVSYGGLNEEDKEIREYIIINENILIAIKPSGKKEEYSFKLTPDNCTVEEVDIGDIYGYSIEYVLNGGTNPEGAVTSYKEGQVVTFPTPTKTNDDMFEGWYQNEDFTGEKLIKTEVTTKGKLKLYARWVSPTKETYFNWSTSGTDATITGLSNEGLQKYNEGSLIEIVFPKTYNNGTYTVRNINEGVLSNKTNIKKVFIPSNITNIGKNVFANCGNINDGGLIITLEPGRTTLSRSFFHGADTLKTIVIPEGVTTIEGYSYYAYDGSSTGAFYGCRNLTNVTIPSSVTNIGPYAFYECLQLTNIPEMTGITTISERAFKKCTGLIQINIPSNINNIGTSAFEGCTNIEGVILPQTDITLGDTVFSGCRKLSNITIPSKVNSIGKNTFSGCGETEGELIVTLEAGRTTLSRSFFHGANYLKTIEVPGGVTTLEGYSYIGGDDGSTGVFYGCSNLTNVTIPSSVTNVGPYIFYGCSQLTDIPEMTGVTGISEREFRKCTGLTQIDIPSNIHNIGTSAFDGCTNIEEITLPQTDITLGDTVFSGCRKLSNITIPSKVNSIGKNTFSGCGETEGELIVTLEPGRTTLSRSFFHGANYLKTIVIPEGVTTLEGYSYYGIDGSSTGAFYGCTNLRNVTIPSTTTNIGPYIFYNCINLTNLNYNNTIETWNSVGKGDKWNNGVPSTNVICTDGTI